MKTQNEGTGQGELKAQDERTRPMTFGNWIGTLLLMLIPLVNIILLFIWAFGSRTNINKKNFARADLVIMAIGIVIYVIVFVGMMYNRGNSVPGV